MQMKTFLWALGVGTAAALTAELILPRQMEQVRHCACRAMNAVEDGASKAVDALM